MSLKVKIADKIVINTGKNFKPSEKQRDKQTSKTALRAFLILANLGFSFGRHRSEAERGQELSLTPGGKFKRKPFLLLS